MTIHVEDFEDINTRACKFAGPSELADFLVNTSNHISRDRADWRGDDMATGLSYLRNGSTRYLARAQAIVDKMADEMVFSSGQPVICSDYVGYAPNVGNALMGHPQDMYNIEYVDNSVLAPLTIYYNVTVSQGVSVEQIIKRGAAALSFAIAMSAIRPVELYTVSAGKLYDRNIVVSCRVPSNPIDLERAAFMLCDPTFARRLAFCTMHDVEVYNRRYHAYSGVSWEWGLMPSDPRSQTNMRRCLGAEEQDIYLYAGHLYDTQMLTNPVQWVKDMIAKHRGEIVE